MDAAAPRVGDVICVEANAHGNWVAGRSIKAECRPEKRKKRDNPREGCETHTQVLYKCHTQKVKVDACVQLAVHRHALQKLQTF